MTTLKLELSLVLPSDAAACDACVSRLVDALSRQSAIQQAHVDRTQPAAPKLCLHYDAAAIRVEAIKKLVETTGAQLGARVEHLSVPIQGLRHERQSRLVEAVVVRLAGVVHASVAFGTEQLYVEYDPARVKPEAIVAAVAEAGVEPAPAVPTAPPDGHGDDDGHGQHQHPGLFGAKSELVFSLTCGALAGVGWGLEKLQVSSLVTTGLFVVAYLAGGWFTIQEVVVALRARRFEIDFLMLLAAIGAAVLGEWFEGALLLFLFTLGHALEGFAMRRARNAIEALARLVPETALRLDGSGGHREVPLSELQRGDTVLVKPNTRIPADGFVVEGASAVNQAPITGESVPVDKRAVSDAAAALEGADRLDAEFRVFAGAINGTGVLKVRVTKRASDSTLARVVRMVAEAETQKSATQQFTDKFERTFVPVILAVVVALLFAGLVIDEPFSQSLYRALAVLVAASPCALAIATPSAVLSGVARAARQGVLVKGGAHLESLGQVRAVAFDKTGTLTEGKPRLVEAEPWEGATEDELLATAAAVEKHSDHPLASAIVDGVKRGRPQLQVPQASGVEAIVGHGVTGTVNGVTVSIGKPGLFAKQGGLPASLSASIQRQEAAGRTVMVVRAGERFLGVVGVMDTPREEARAVVAALHALGVEQTIMLTGDNQRVADAVAARIGIREARGDLLPEQKVAAITELAKSRARVAMVGDGVNDAPAMANATVGIAMGAGGSDVALETADVALMGDDLRGLPFAVGLSRAARRIILQNLWVSLGMVAFLVPATIFGFARIGVAVALHEGSTMLVVINALRLLAYRARQPDAAPVSNQPSSTSATPSPP